MTDPWATNVARTILDWAARGEGVELDMFIGGEKVTVTRGPLPSEFCVRGQRTRSGIIFHCTQSPEEMAYSIERHYPAGKAIEDLQQELHQAQTTLATITGIALKASKAHCDVDANVLIGLLKP